MKKRSAGRHGGERTATLIPKLVAWLSTLPPDQRDAVAKLLEEYFRQLQAATGRPAV